MKFGTKAIHAGISPDPTTGAVMTPIFQTSTYAQRSPGDHQGYEYSRTHNPTRTVLQNNLAALENGKYGLCFATGMAAIDAVLRLLRPGDEVIAADDMYGGTFRVFTKVFSEWGLKFHFADMSDPESLRPLFNDRTRLVWVETPTNPLLNVVDIAAVAEVARAHGTQVAVDNTFATPYLQTPLDLGADIVIHSLTKYMGGHSDVVMGSVVVNDADIFERLAFLQNACGATPGPQDCFLVLRGLKTLHVRLDRHCDNAAKVAEFLRSHPKVDQVYYPGFESHPNHAVARKQMRHYGGMVSFMLRGDSLPEAYTVMENLEVFTLGESLGGVESLCTHPTSMTHASIPKEQREARGLKDTLIRLSVGLEDADDLIEDLRRAIAHVSEAAAV